MGFLNTLKSKLGKAKDVVDDQVHQHSDKIPDKIEKVYDKASDVVDKVLPGDAEVAADEASTEA